MEAGQSDHDVDSWLLVREMRHDDISQAVDLWREHGFNQCLNIVSIFYQLDPGGFFVAVNTRTGAVVATCTCVRQHPALFVIGMYAAHKNLHGRGVASRVWEAMARRLGQDCNVLINAMPAALPIYRNKAGFALVEPWFTITFKTTAVTIENLPLAPDYLRVVSIDHELIDEVIAYDTHVHCFERAETVLLTIDDTDGLSRAVVRRQNGRVVVCGFGKISTDIQGGAMVGPLYAEDSLVAGALLRDLVESYDALARIGLCMKVLECNADACKLAEELGCAPLNKIARCYLKERVPARLEEVYAQHDLSFCTV